MPKFNRDNLRRGKEAIDKANEDRQKGGDYKPFLSNLLWKGDQDKNYILFLNRISDIPQADVHPFIELDDGRPHQTMARTDTSIGMRTDPIQAQWKYKPRLTNLAIAAELEPITEIRDGRAKPVGFEIKTRSFERKVEGSDDEREEVTAPVVGLVAQSPYNFFNQLSSFNASEAPIETTPLKITRIGEKQNVTYQVIGYEDIDLDRTNLLEYIENVSYIQQPEELLTLIDGLDEVEASITIGNYLLDLVLDELADEDNYNEILGAITQPSRFAEKDKKDREDKPARATRSQRRQKAEPDADETEAKPEVSKASPAQERLARLQERAAKAKKAA